jgi:hypothetical protein
MPSPRGRTRPSQIVSAAPTTAPRAAPRENTAVQPVQLGDSLSVIPPTQVKADVVISIDGDMRSVPTTADVVHEVREGFTLVNIKAKYNGSDVQLTGSQYNAAHGLLSNHLRAHLSDLAWNRIVELRSKLIANDYNHQFDDKRAAAVQRRKDGEELARALQTFEKLLGVQGLKMPKALGRKAIGQVEANAEMAFYLLKKMAGQFKTMNGSFYQGMANEALSLVAACFPDGEGPNNPGAARRRRS